MTIEDIRALAPDVSDDDDPAPSALDSGLYMDPTEHTQAEFDAAKALCFWCNTGERAEDSKFCGLACEEADRDDNMTFGED